MVCFYGSVVEDLKSFVLDDYGDMDIMVFLILENCLVYEELLEYLFNNLLYVKIKGCDYFVF